MVWSGVNHFVLDSYIKTRETLLIRFTGCFFTVCFWYLFLLGTAQFPTRVLLQGRGPFDFIIG